MKDNGPAQGGFVELIFIEKQQWMPPHDEINQWSTHLWLIQPYFRMPFKLSICIESLVDMRKMDDAGNLPILHPERLAQLNGMQALASPLFGPGKRVAFEMLSALQLFMCTGCIAKIN